MYDSSLFEQFITDIRVIDLGQTVIIDCCPSGQRLLRLKKTEPALTVGQEFCAHSRSCYNQN